MSYYRAVVGGEPLLDPGNTSRWVVRFFWLGTKQIRAFYSEHEALVESWWLLNTPGYRDVHVYQECLNEPEVPIEEVRRYRLAWQDLS